MPRTEKIKSDLDLAGTKSRCEQTQRAGFKLASIEAQTETVSGTVLSFNEAKFVDAISIDILDKLNFVPAESSESLDSVKQRTPDWTFICDAPRMYISGHVKRAVVFGKKTT
jgi:hypothetical protein